MVVRVTGSSPSVQDAVHLVPHHKGDGAGGRITSSTAARSGPWSFFAGDVVASVFRGVGRTRLPKGTKKVAARKAAAKNATA
jgi:hypothetical protein